MTLFVLHCVHLERQVCFGHCVVLAGELVAESFRAFQHSLCSIPEMMIVSAVETAIQRAKNVLISRAYVPKQVGLFAVFQRSSWRGDDRVKQSPARCREHTDVFSLRP